MTEGETHVPPIIGSTPASSALRAKQALGALWAPVSIFAHLVLGWPM